jgi:hypothetical protein
VQAFVTQPDTTPSSTQSFSYDSGHNRIHERLIEYWQELCAGRAFPKESDIDPSQIAPIWDACFLVQMNSVGPTFKYSYLGVSLIEAWGDDASNEGVSSNLIDPATASLIHKFQEVADTKRPVIDESEFINKKKMRVKYRICMLPLGTAPDKVNFILGGMKWKAY